MDQLVVFSVDEQLYGLPLEAVIRVINAVYVSKLPNSPNFIEGVIKIREEYLPVINLRKRFGSPSREIEAEDQFILLNTGKRKVVFMTDKVLDIKSLTSDQWSKSTKNINVTTSAQGVAEIEGELMFIFDPELFINLEEEKSIVSAMEKLTLKF